MPARPAGDAAKARFDAVVAALAGEPEVVPPGAPRPGRQFGVNGLRVGRRIFAMLVEGRLVVKLPKARVDALVDQGVGERFDPGHGRLQKEWLAVHPDAAADWTVLAREALAFVGRRPPPAGARQD